MEVWFTKFRVTEFFKHIITKISGGEIRHRIGECACNLIHKFRFSLWLYNSFSHLYGLFLLKQLARVLLVQVKGVCCVFFSGNATDMNH